MRNLRKKRARAGPGWKILSGPGSARASPPAGPGLTGPGPKLWLAEKNSKDNIAHKFTFAYIAVELIMLYRKDEKVPKARRNKYDSNLMELLSKSEEIKKEVDAHYKAEMNRMLEKNRLKEHEKNQKEKEDEETRKQMARLEKLRGTSVGSSTDESPNPKPEPEPQVKISSFIESNQISVKNFFQMCKSNKFQILLLDCRPEKEESEARINLFTNAFSTTKICRIDGYYMGKGGQLLNQILKFTNSEEDRKNLENFNDYQAIVVIHSKNKEVHYEAIKKALSIYQKRNPFNADHIVVLQGGFEAFRKNLKQFIYEKDNQSGNMTDSVHSVLSVDSNKGPEVSPFVNISLDNIKITEQQKDNPLDSKKLSFSNLNNQLTGIKNKMSSTIRHIPRFTSTPYTQRVNLSMDDDSINYKSSQRPVFSRENKPKVQNNNNKQIISSEVSESPFTMIGEKYTNDDNYHFGMEAASVNDNIGPVPTFSRSNKPKIKKKRRRTSSLGEVEINPITPTIQSIKDLSQEENVFEKTKKINQEIIHRLQTFDMPLEVNHIRGLKNLGNTCYMNAVLQCLVRLPNFSSFFLNSLWKNQISYHNSFGFMGNLVQQFSSTTKELYQPKNPGSSGPCYTYSYNPKELRQVIARKYPDFGTSRQQDAQEFLVRFLDGLHEDMNQSRATGKKIVVAEVDDEELDFHSSKINHPQASEMAWKRHLQQNQSPLINLLQGQYMTITKSDVSNTTRRVFEPFMVISLPLPDSGYHTTSIDKCIENFQGWERIDDFYDGNLKEFVKAKRRMVLRDWKK